MEPGAAAPPPEAEVIRLAREAMGMTAQSAAEATRALDVKGVSPTYWRDVEHGYGGRRGQRVPVRASDSALAAMARVVGVAPRQLTAAGREDSARVLEEILRREERPPVPPPQRAAVENDDPALRPYIQSVLRDIYTAAGIMPRLGPGQELPGIEATPEIMQLFEQIPGSQVFRLEHEAKTWDTDLIDAPAKVRAIARWRRLAAEYEDRARNAMLGRP